jgi:hypothetical protein
MDDDFLPFKDEPFNEEEALDIETIEELADKFYQSLSEVRW